MKKIILSFTALATLSMVGMLFFNNGNLYSNGDGAPGQGTCSTSGCHNDGGPAQTSNDVSLIITDNAGTAITSYVAGEKYNVTFGKHAATTKVGFALSTNAGTLTKNSGDTKIKKTGSYLTHTSNGTAVSGGHAEWTATWTAPAAGTATLQLFINETNNNGSSTGDVIYSKTLTLTAGVTGLNKLSSDVYFKVYPNPTTEKLTIAFDIKYQSPIAITLTSIDGKTSSELYNGTEDKGRIEKLFDVSELAKGIYFLNIKSEQGNVFQKILIN